ncbi:MAG: hypothetical protein QF805_25920, partial [Pirellulaceae bacterium]|nr:hypothetical protein [Pirellulaceae bacterium]
MSNPYQATSLDESIPSHDLRLPPPREQGLVGQVRIVAILMVVQGALELVMGVFLVVIGLMARGRNCHAAGSYTAAPYSVSCSRWIRYS